MEIIANRMGDVRKSKNLPVAASQVLTKGMPITLAAGLVTAGTIATAAIYGFTTHATTTGAAVTERDRVIVEPCHSDEYEFKGELKAGTAVTAALVGSDAGFIIENGYFKIDPAAAVKQVRIVAIVEGGDPVPQCKFIVKDANRAIV